MKAQQLGDPPLDDGLLMAPPEEWMPNDPALF